jgi:branched-chain amino acid transport system permease protein
VSKQTLVSQLIGAAVLLSAIILPFAAPHAEYALDVLFLIFLYGAMSSAWNIIGGFAGQISFGHAAFLGVGAYTTMILWGAGWSPWATLPIAGGLAALFSIIVGVPSFRLRGPYFSIATIGIGEATRLIALNWSKLTGGASGLTMAEGPSPEVQYLSALALCVAAFAVSWWIVRSRFGFALAAIKQDTDAAQTLGVPTTLVKTQALAISAALVGIAGSVYAMHYLYVSPDSVFGFSTAIALVIMPIIGGVGTVWGPLIGAVVYTFIREEFAARLASADLLAFGLLLIAIVLFEPKGIVGAWQALAKRRAAGRRAAGAHADG